MLKSPPPSPSDWPEDGSIDLAIHDRPHASSTTEWWYQNGHVEAGGQRYSFFAAFFRQVKGYDEKTRAPLYAHSLTWALFDPEEGVSHTVSRVDQSAPEEGMKRVRRGLGGKDHKLNRALQEILERGHVPTPDRMFDGRVFVHQDKLHLQYGPDTFRKLDDGRYELKLKDKKKNVGLSLVLTPKKPPVRQGDNGVVRGSSDESMFYYFIPRCEVTGTITHRGATHEITKGQGWYDHEFGVGEREDVDDAAEAKLDDETRKRIHAERRAGYEKRQVAWDWLSTQFDDGSELSVYSELYVNIPKMAGHWAVRDRSAGQEPGPHGHHDRSHRDLAQHADVLRVPGEVARARAEREDRHRSRRRVRRLRVHHADLEAVVLGRPHARARLRGRQAGHRPRRARAQRLRELRRSRRLLRRGRQGRAPLRRARAAAGSPTTSRPAR